MCAPVCTGNHGDLCTSIFVGETPGGLSGASFKCEFGLCGKTDGLRLLLLFVHVVEQGEIKVRCNLQVCLRYQVTWRCRGVLGEHLASSRVTCV